MNDYTKPPLGAEPYYVAAAQRILELAQAIERASEEIRNYPGHVSLWAKEIIIQCDVLKMMEKEEGRT